MTTEQLTALKEVAEKALNVGAAITSWEVTAAMENFKSAFRPATCLELLGEVERLRTDGDELSGTIEACHVMLDKVDPEYEEGMTTLTPLDTRLQEFLWPEGRITDDMVNGDD
jgi:hypothetical protein